MVTVFRYRKQLLEVAEIDFLSQPKVMPEVLRRREAVAKEYGLDPGQISVCAQPLAEVHGEQKAGRIRRPPGKAAGAPRASGVPMTPDEILVIKDTLGMTFAELAERLNVSVRSVQRWCAPLGSRTHTYPSGPALRMLRGLKERASKAQKETPGD